MAKTKVGTIGSWHQSTPLLAIFHLMPEEGAQFPPYKAGQYIALRRDDCLLTKKAVCEGGKVEYVPNLDDQGNQKRGPVTHSYSISSAPFETIQNKSLEIYIILEKNDKGVPGRLTESMFRMDPKGDNKMAYYDIITGVFTLDKRAVGCRNVIFVGTGTGVAPFASMIKQLDFEASQGKRDEVHYIMLHTNRTYEELDYYEKMSAIEAANRFNFTYIPTVSRPTQRDVDDLRMGKGRANNVLRRIFDMPTKEEQDLKDVKARKEDPAKAKAALERTVKPVLPEQISAKELQASMNTSDTVIMTCGNVFLMEDIKTIADANHIRFEKEDW